MKTGFLLVSTLLCLQTAQPAPAQPTVWLMGEVHDNSRGHALRHQLLAEKVGAGWRPSIVMEQFDREQQTLLDAALVTCKTAACITSQSWVESWDWPLYESLIQLALDFQLPLLAGNVSRRDVAYIVKGGYPAALDQSTLSNYRLDEPLPRLLADQHKANIIAGHCNMLPDSVAEKMVPAQVARDVWMAKVIEQQAAKGDVVLIAGNGHVQKDVGVFQWLPVGLRKHTTAYGFLEQGEAWVDSNFDVVHPLPVQTREDPCEAFKAMMKK